MSDHPTTTSDDRVVSIRTRRRYEAAGSAETSQSPELNHYERSAEPDDFRHRTMVNVVAFLFVGGLVLAGFWLADTITTMRKTQDCILMGKRGCAPVEAPAPAR